MDGRKKGNEEGEIGSNVEETGEYIREWEIMGYRLGERMIDIGHKGSRRL